MSEWEWFKLKVEARYRGLGKLWIHNDPSPEQTYLRGQLSELGLMLQMLEEFGEDHK